MSYLEYYKDIIIKALYEDIGKRDVTADNIDIEDQPAKAVVIAKSEGVVCGLDVVSNIFYLLDKEIIFKRLKGDGKKIKKGEVLAEMAGPAASILKGERVALNFLNRLSGIATLTSKYVAIAGKKNIKIYDTRKTTPCLRVLEKYAVKVGGGENHRFGLYDQVLIKENHLRLLERKIDMTSRGECQLFLEALKRKIGPKIKVEVEANNLEMVKKISRCKVDIIMLDNFKASQIKKAIQIIRKNNKRMEIEVSGNINLRNIKKYLFKGINRISIGEITHSAPALDFSLLIL